MIDCLYSLVSVWQLIDCEKQAGGTDGSVFNWAKTSLADTSFDYWWPKNIQHQLNYDTDSLSSTQVRMITGGQHRPCPTKADLIRVICWSRCHADFVREAPHSHFWLDRQMLVPGIKKRSGHNSRATLQLKWAPCINHILLLWLSTSRGLDPFQSFLIESMKQIK